MCVEIDIYHQLKCDKLVSKSYYHGDYDSIRKSLSHVDWDSIMLKRTGQDTWILFESRMKAGIEE